MEHFFLKKSANHLFTYSYICNKSIIIYNFLTMTKQDLVRQADSTLLSLLQQKNIYPPEWASLLKEYDSRFHPVNDKSIRPDKIKKDNRIEKVSRIHLDIEKLITTRMVEFMFAIPVNRYYYNIDDDEDKIAIRKAIELVYKTTRINTENLERAKLLLTSCEVATLWYAADQPTSVYGFESQKKLKCKTFSPMNGYELYPIFDEYDNMIAMSIKWTAKHSSENDTFFETYTDNRHIRWKNNELEIDEPNTLGKIPIVYSYRPKPIWDGIQHLINELEFTLSRNSDVIAYNASPVLAITGKIIGNDNKDSSQKVYKFENGGGVQYVTWTQAIEAIKYHVETLFRLIWQRVQLPDLSFENIKGMGAVSGEARKTLLTDAHLKVGDEQGAFIEYFEREANIIKAYLKKLNPAWSNKVDEIEIEHIITPFIQNDEANVITRYINANGGKPLVSWKESIELAGLSSDADQTFEQLQQEQAQEQATKMSGLFESE